MISQYQNLTEEDGLEVVPNKVEMSMVKLKTHCDQVVQVYSIEYQPAFFQIHTTLYPTG